MEALTGVWASRHSEELRRGITIKLGYANASFYKCPNHPPPTCYTTQPLCPLCGSQTEFLRKVSFVDAPGHEILMTTMLSGAAVMDAALFVIGADEPCPQPQTREHMLAAEIMGIKHLIVAQNKIDIVTKERAIESYEEIKAFLEKTPYADAPVIPISALKKANIDALIEAIQKYFPTPERNPNLPPIMFAIRTFDVNKPGTPVERLEGGIVGGSLLQGSIAIGDEIEIRPGVPVKKNGKYEFISLQTEVKSLMAGDVPVEKATCGGLLGIGTYLDPSLTKSDRLVGSLVGYPNHLPDVVNNITLHYTLFKEVVGTREQIKISPLQKGELLALNVGSTLTSGVIEWIKGDVIQVHLNRPVCPLPNQRAAISRRIAQRWRLIGYGTIVT